MYPQKKGPAEAEPEPSRNQPTKIDKFENLVPEQGCGPTSLEWGARSGPLSAPENNNRKRISSVSYLTQCGQKERVSPLTVPSASAWIT
jgi:hypothetical protein